MSFALALILLFVVVPFLLLVLDLGVRRRPAQGRTEPAEGPVAVRPGVIAPGDGMVHRSRG